MAARQVQARRLLRFPERRAAHDRKQQPRKFGQGGQPAGAPRVRRRTSSKDRAGDAWAVWRSTGSEDLRRPVLRVHLLVDPGHGRSVPSPSLARRYTPADFDRSRVPVAGQAQVCVVGPVRLPGCAPNRPRRGRRGTAARPGPAAFLVAERARLVARGPAGSARQPPIGQRPAARPSRRRPGHWPLGAPPASGPWLSGMARGPARAPRPERGPPIGRRWPEGRACRFSAGPLRRSAWRCPHRLASEMPWPRRRPACPAAVAARFARPDAFEIGALLERPAGAILFRQAAGANSPSGRGRLAVGRKPRHAVGASRSAASACQAGRQPTGSIRSPTSEHSSLPVRLNTPQTA